MNKVNYQANLLEEISAMVKKCVLMALPCVCANDFSSFLLIEKGKHTASFMPQLVICHMQNKVIHSNNLLYSCMLGVSPTFSPLKH